MLFICKLSKIYNIITIKLQQGGNMKNKNKKRFVLLVDGDIYEKFKELAKKQNRTAGNLGTTLINEYVEKNNRTSS